MKNVPEPRAGDDITAEWGAEVARACNRTLIGPGVTEHPKGYSITWPGYPLIELWELTGYPTFDANTKEYKAGAKRVFVENTSTYYKYESESALTDTVWFPAFMRQSGNDTLRCAPGFTTLSRVNCIRSQAGRLVVLDGLPRVIQFELKTNLAPAGNATAYLIKEDGTVDTGVTFTVYDAPEGDRRGLGRDTTGTSGGVHGSRGKAIIGSSGHFEIISLDSSSSTLRPFVLTQNTWPSCIDAGGVAATTSATVLWKDDETAGTVWFSRLGLAGTPDAACNAFGIGRGGGSTPLTSTFGFAKYDTLTSKWYVISGSFTIFTAGKVVDTIADGAVGTCEVWWTELVGSSKTMVNSGQTVEALNWIPGAVLEYITPCALMYSPPEQRWYIVAPGVNPCAC